MQKLVNESKGGWKKFFNSLFVTADPKEETKKMIRNSELSDINKTALIKSLDLVDDMGKNMFNYGKEDNKKTSKSISPKGYNREEKSEPSRKQIKDREDREDRVI
ncbi:MAG: hypothetical protein IJH39_06855 [Clostridia bacterium]|nr:hypothetical protein [Clostridia bacterium]